MNDPKRPKDDLDKKIWTQYEQWNIRSKIKKGGLRNSWGDFITWKAEL
jgi:hypothetical protein